MKATYSQGLIHVDARILKEGGAAPAEKRLVDAVEQKLFERGYLGAEKADCEGEYRASMCAPFEWTIEDMQDDYREIKQEIAEEARQACYGN